MTDLSTTQTTTYGYTGNIVSVTVGAAGYTTSPPTAPRAAAGPRRPAVMAPALATPAEPTALRAMPGAVTSASAPAADLAAVVILYSRWWSPLMSLPV